MNNDTYLPCPADTSDVVLPPEILALAELLAEDCHETWAAGRIAQGWTYGPRRDDALRQTPCLVPYGELPDEEKEYDRKTTAGVLKLIIKLGYKITPPADKT